MSAGRGAAAARSGTAPAVEPAAESGTAPAVEPDAESGTEPAGEPAAESVPQAVAESVGTVVEPPTETDSDEGSEIPGVDAPPDLEDFEDTQEIVLAQPDPALLVGVAADVPCGQQASIASSSSASAR